MNTVLNRYVFPTAQVISLVQGDLLAEPVDAIVNPANENLLHGAGVAGLIARQGGPVINRESGAWIDKHGRVKHERPAYTSAGNLPQRYVIHAVGPVWRGGEDDEDAKLAAATRGSLQVAQELGVASIGFPAISTGIFGFPKERAAKVMLAAIHSYYQDTPDCCVDTVRLTVYDDSTVTAFSAAWEDFHAQL